MFERFIDNKETLALPMSGNRYMVNINGSITDNFGNKVIPFSDPKNQLLVKLNWYAGDSLYFLSEVLAHTFKPTKVPHKYWSQLTVRFLDGNSSNLHPSNLAWKFPIGLGAKENNGFSYIPMFSRYLINIEGVIFDKRTLKIQAGHYNKGYISFSLTPDIGPRTCLKRHRGICLAFTDYPLNADQLQVNHKNGIPGSDALDNLEWMTCSENKIHAVENSLTSVNKPVEVLDLSSGEVTEYISLKKLCERFGFNDRKITSLLMNPEEPLVHENYSISFKNSDHAVLKNTCSVKMLRKDLRTGAVDEFESINDCARSSNVSKHIVQWRLNNPGRQVYADGFLFKKKSDATDWYECSDFELELLNSDWNKKVLIKDLTTGIVHEFSSQRVAADYLKIAESTMNQRLSTKGQPVFKDEVNSTYVILKNKSDTSEWREVKNAEEESVASGNVKKISVKNAVSGIVKDYESAAECSRELGLLTTTLHWRLKSAGQKLFSDGLLFKYRSDPKPFMEISESLLKLITDAPNVSNHILTTS